MRHPAVLLLLALAALCGCSSSTAGGDPPSAGGRPALTIGAIPDQDPEQLARLHPVVAQELSARLGVPVRFRPVTDYAAAVTAFRTGDLQLVWFGGLTGVQARHQVPGARPLAQRDVDRRFRSVFVASRRSGLRPVRDVAGLRALRGRRFTFGSPSSTSGRLMPQLFLERAGVRTGDLRGRAGFSGSHDATLALVASGSYEAGAVNEQVWEQRLAEGEVDRDALRVIWRTPTYHDYAWIARPDLDARFGRGFTDRVGAALRGLDRGGPRARRILRLFGARRFVAVGPRDHDEVARIARRLGLLDGAGA